MGCQAPIHEFIPLKRQGASPFAVAERARSTQEQFQIGENGIAQLILCVRQAGEVPVGAQTQLRAARKATAGSRSRCSEPTPGNSLRLVEHPAFVMIQFAALAAVQRKNLLLPFIQRNTSKPPAPRPAKPEPAGRRKRCDRDTRNDLRQPKQIFNTIVSLSQCPSQLI